jgi:hypothetical protein
MKGNNAYFAPACRHLQTRLARRKLVQPQPWLPQSGRPCYVCGALAAMKALKVSENALPENCGADWSLQVARSL